MSDPAIIFDGIGYTLQTEDGDLLADDGLENAVLISLLTDQRVTALEVPVPGDSRRGWWADELAEIPGDKIGSKLWLLDRSVITDANLQKWEFYARQSLKWMITDMIAEEVICTATRIENDRIHLKIELVRPDSENDVFSFLWENQILKRVS